MAVKKTPKKIVKGTAATHYQEVESRRTKDVKGAHYGHKFVQKGNMYVRVESANEDSLQLKKASLTKSHVVALASFDWNDDSRGYDLVSVIRDGIDYKTFRIVAEKTPLNDADWAIILDTTTRTLDRKKKHNKKFASKQTETIIEIQQLMQYGEQVFEDKGSFHNWLMTENVALGGTVPKDLLDTSVGLGMVRDELGRIEHGILA